MSKWLENEAFIAPLGSYTDEEIEFFLRRGCWIRDDETNKITNEYWNYHDYIKHGVFPGIDDCIEAMGGYIDPWTGRDVRDIEGNDATVVRGLCKESSF